MPKMKSHSAAKKRFRSNASGSTIKRGCPGTRHNTGQKSQKRMKRLSGGSSVSKADSTRIANAIKEEEGD